tara:strand:- start:30417 stop:31865 length:1449 start_codon:yes stop_codon:yes gene_type:complete
MRRGLVFLALASAAVLSACTTNPATGRTQLATLSSAEDDARQGAQAHPQILASYGGAYDDMRVGQYVAQVTQRVTHATGQPDRPYRVTVLDSPVVNAFALPGGYVYVTRGLLSLVNDEAELAGVLGHEIGHVLARHSAQRQTAAFGASVVGAVLGAVVGNQAVSQAVGLGSQGLIAGYSRDQEYEADALGVRYLAAGGYDPYAQADFLQAMDINARAEAQIAGRNDDGQANWLSSHPATPERVAAARRLAGQTSVTSAQGDRSRAALLKAVDGMIYGDSPAQGFVRGRSFIHSVARFRFDVPQGYQLANGTNAVMAVGPRKEIAKFDSAKKAKNVSIDAYLARVWAHNVPISPVRRFSIHGLNAASADTQIGNYNARLVAIDAGQGKVYRFLLGVPRQGGASGSASALESIASSFRLISAREAASFKPLRLHVVTVRAGDTMASLSRRMAFDDHKLERFRALNGLPANAVLQAGQKVKLAYP